MSSSTPTYDRKATQFDGPVNIEYTAELDFTDGDNNDEFANSGVPVLLSAKLKDTSDSPIAGQQVEFQHYLMGSWESIPDDGIHMTSLTTDTGGQASVYYLPLTEGAVDIPVRAAFADTSECVHARDGSAGHGLMAHLTTKAVEAWPRV